MKEKNKNKTKQRNGGKIKKCLITRGRAVYGVVNDYRKLKKFVVWHASFEEAAEEMERLLLKEGGVFLIVRTVAKGTVERIKADTTAETSDKEDK